jgi:Sec-independent protein translocase protein TatA
MEIFGVGPLEFLLILVMALVILGPQDMVSTARKIGQWVYRVVRSPTWQAILATTQDLRELPQKIVRDAGIEEAMQEVKGTVDEAKSELNAATRDVTVEMQSASYAAANEMQAAALSANAGMNEGLQGINPISESIGAEAEEGFQSEAVAETGENTIWPEQTLANFEPEIPDVAVDPYIANLEAFSQALGGGAPCAPKPEVETAPVFVPQTISPEMIAMALTQDSYSSISQDASPAPVEEEPPQPSWAAGVPAGLTEETGISERLQQQMDEITKRLERLEPKEPGE